MAETLNIPKGVVDSNVDVDYAIYSNNEKKESEYISPTEVSKESIDKIEKRNKRIGHFIRTGELAA